MEAEQTELERRRRIQLAAYYLWRQRGSPFGTPEIDWFQAEAQLGEGNDESSQKPALVAAAEMIGSALGSVAGLMTSAGNLVPRSDETSGPE